MTKPPFILSNRSTRGIMGDVLIALLPAMVASVIIFGLRSLLLTAVCVIFSILTEAVFCICKRVKVTVTDLSAAVTGVLLAFSLPAGFPLWMAALGSIFAIAVVKMLFGGIGENFANPAAAGRIFLFLSFSKEIADFTGRGIVSGATPLSGGESDILKLFLGVRNGCVGETCVLALLIGFIYMICRRVITPTAPIFTILGAAFMSFICKRDVFSDLMSGGLILSAVFMVTDYATSPVRERGKAIYGFFVGLITIIIRAFASYPEGVSFAILIMNIVSPLIDKMTYRMPFGGVKTENA